MNVFAFVFIYNAFTGRQFIKKDKENKIRLNAAHFSNRYYYNSPTQFDRFSYIFLPHFARKAIFWELMNLFLQ